jgi:Protein of unknown function (DUF2939)
LRRVAIVAAVITAVVIAYAGSAIWSVSSLLLAVRAGDGAAMVRQTDLPRLRDMLVAQIVEAYLDRVGGKRQLERLVVAAYGPSVADALVGKILDEGLTRLLRDGVVQDPARPSAHVSLAPLGALKPGELAELASRIRPFKPLEFDLRISPSDDPKIYTAARFRLEGVRWKLSGLILPPAIAADIAAMIVEPARRP